jgi:hypothetical protein
MNFNYKNDECIICYNNNRLNNSIDIKYINICNNCLFSYLYSISGSSVKDTKKCIVFGLDCDICNKYSNIIFQSLPVCNNCIEECINHSLL